MRYSTAGIELLSGFIFEPEIEPEIESEIALLLQCRLTLPK